MPSSFAFTPGTDANSAVSRPSDGWSASLLQQAQAALPAFLLSKRWYPAKDAGLPEVALTALVDFPLPDEPHAHPCAVSVWRVMPPRQAPLHLLVGLAVVPIGSVQAADVITALASDLPGNPNDSARERYDGSREDSTRIGRDRGNILVEAFSVDAFVHAWVDMLLRPGTGTAGVAALHPVRTPQLDRAVSGRESSVPAPDGQVKEERECDEVGTGAAGRPAVRRSSAEQSNTSLRIGDSMILKVIRRLEEGIHPEMEIGRFLTSEAGFDATPAMLGWIDLESATGTSAATVSILQAFVPNQGDGWHWVLERLAEGVAADPANLGHNGALERCDAWLHRLGVRTAQMHRAFGIDTADQAFHPELVRPQDLRTWSAATRELIAQALRSLEAAGPRLTPEARDLAQAVLARKDSLSTHLDSLLWTEKPQHPTFQPDRSAGQDRAGQPSTWPHRASQPGGQQTDDAASAAVAFAKTRHHGDFHLGQVLVSGDDAVIVDFEGEPMRPLAERRAKHAALRDVAGLLRSLAYAAAAAGRTLAPHLDAKARESALSRLATWERDAARAYLDAYLDAAQGTPGCPSDRGSAERLIRFFMLEKAIYEIGYELANRPDWVAIPLRGVLALLDDDSGTARSVTGGHDATRRIHRMPFGADVRDDGSVRFALWAPSHERMHVVIDGQDEPLPMEVNAEGWHELITDRASPGSRYRFILPQGASVPDPASRYQPEDVHGPSEVIAPLAYVWRDGRWRGRALEEAVVYELHVGAFTPQGTFSAAIGKLDHLASLGVTAIELMPISDFPGARNWGYDGVLPYAPAGAYGRPEDLKALVDAAHARGLMVLLDVVYNHFGPEGAYLHTIAPQTFTDRHKTPWGAAINTDGANAGPVREFFIHNALYWIEEFHLDGLRLDAVHAILDDSEKHLLEELAERVRAAAPERQVHLFLENEENQASRLVRAAGGKPRWYSAQWNDDVHHVLHVAVSNESSGYYADYHADTGKLGRALAEGFAFQGEAMHYRGHPRGEPSAALPPTAFVAFIQNHDQIGNRAFGDRLTASASPQAVRAAAAVYLLLPQIPMLFMGEEWAASQPFPFFCDFGPDLADAVRQGRRNEFARFPEFRDPAMRERIPDPMAKQTFDSAKLDWDEQSREPHAGWLDWYRRALAMRHAQIVPILKRISNGGACDVIGKSAVVVRWRVGEDGELVLAANLSDKAVSGFPRAAGETLWREGEADPDGGTFGAWAARWSLAAPKRRDPVPGAKASDLDRLASHMGIEPEFLDARESIVRASDETKRSLLAAMGIDAHDAGHTRAALEAATRSAWLHPLPPVQVVQAEGPAAAVDMVMPAGTRDIAWRLQLEDGTERTDRTLFDGLALTAERTVEGRALQRRRLVVGGDLPWGYHRLTVDPGGETTLIVTPGRCWLPPALEDGRRLWGIAAQLYLLRSRHDWGVGDFGDLRRLVELAAARGADVIGLNPLHAMFHNRPEHASPYSPASRFLLNILYIDVEAMPEFAESSLARDLISGAAFGQAIDHCRAQALVAYTEVTALKVSALEALFETCRSSPDQGRWRGFEIFRLEQGEVLERNCRYFALQESFATRDPALADWHDWPDEFKDPESPAVQRFAEEHPDRLAFLAWLQWVADDQLRAVSARAAECAMAVGLYRDLAVGADRAGAETWTNPTAVASGAQVGAPPDIHNPAGQDWGLPPLNPKALRDEAYRSFVQLLRANMRHAGGLRIDHVMALHRLYWIPQGQSPSAGAYVRYPLEDMVGILALESHRHHCLVVGEDLGTVPKGFRERMRDANVFSYRVLFFERDEDTDAFLAPDAYPTLALAVTGSHDLATLRGWWAGRDIDLKESLGLYPDPQEASRQRAMREDERHLLQQALRREGLLPESDGNMADAAAFAAAAHTYLARTPSLLAMVQIDDLTGEIEQVNVPATSDEHPNWRRRLSLTLEQLAASPEFDALAGDFRTIRGNPAVVAPKKGDPPA